MNIESVLNKIELFEELVINSGFKRDIADFTQSIQQAENQNLVFMKDLSERIQKSFSIFENNSLETELKHVLRDNEPFTSKNTVEELKALDANEEIDGAAYFQQFNNILNNLTVAVDSNTSEITSVKKIFSKYVSDKTEFQTEEEQALVSLVFKDLKSTGGLKEFSRVLNRWNNTLLILHGLMKSESPDDISLVEIQNGSIDVIFNIDVNVALDLTDLIKTGLKVYGAYLLYKSSEKVREIINSCLGNKKLIALEEEREKLMLDNIKISVKDRVIELHIERLASDKAIDKTAIDGKAEAVSSVITDHIIKGNEVKLLTLPKPDSDEFDEELDEELDEEDISNELRESTAIVRERFKKLSSEEQTLLLEKYSIEEDGEI